MSLKEVGKKSPESAADHVLFDTCSVLSGYGRDCLDNELDMELDDEEEMDGFTEDRLDSPLIFCVTVI